MAIVLKGQLKINGTDVGSQVTSMTISGSREVIDVPATMATRKSFRAGGDEYELSLGLLQGNDPTSLSMIFFDLLADANGTFTYSGTPFEAGPGSASNPIWSGTALVGDVDLGGDMESLAESDLTFRLTDRPTKSITP